MGLTLVSNYDISDLWIKKVCVLSDILASSLLLAPPGGPHWPGWPDTLVEAIGHPGSRLPGICLPQQTRSSRSVRLFSSPWHMAWPLLGEREMSELLSLPLCPVPDQLGCKPGGG